MCHTRQIAGASTDVDVRGVSGDCSLLYTLRHKIGERFPERCRASSGGQSGQGTVFSIASDSTYTMLHGLAGGQRIPPNS